MQQRSHKTFAAALADFRQNGGAMDYDAGMWCVWEADELAAYLLERGDKTSTKRATVKALAMGGMTRQQIAEELKDWLDDVPEAPRPAKTPPPWRPPRNLYDRAEAEARRRRLGNGQDVKWTHVLREILDKHLPK